MQIGSYVRLAFQKYLFTICAATIITLLLATALGFLLAALYLYLIGMLAPPVAALVTAGAALVLSGLVALSLWLANRYRFARADRIKTSRDTSDQDIGAMDSVLVGIATDWIASNAKKASFAGLLAGVLMGVSPEVRQMLILALRGSAKPK